MAKLKIGAASAVLLFSIVGIASLQVNAQTTPPVPTPIGAWFGIARPCTTNSRFPTPPGTVSQSVCKDACNGVACPTSAFPVDEVVMMPTLLADGTVLATDHASLLDHHSTGQGKWEAAGKTVIDGKSFDRYQASFMWFQPRNPPDVDPRYPLSIFLGVVRPRFVMFFDQAEPDVMKGYIQPYLFAMTDSWGIVNMLPNSPYPAVDPMGKLPTACDPTSKSNPYCLGTLMFVVRRVPAK